MPGLEGALVLEAVAKTYPPDRAVLRGVSLSAAPGDTLAVVGPSGCGKSTLLNIIGSLDTPTSGTVRLGDLDVPSLDGAALAAYRARRVGFVFQDHHLLPQLTAAENVLLPTLAVGRRRDSQRGAGPAVPPGEPADRARELLDQVGVGDVADSFPARISGGQRQRVAVARALINRPRLLLCDEPTGNLDHETGRRVIELLVRVAAERDVIVVMVTHNAEFAGMLRRVVELREGALRAA
jgi:ABC-type lipoprotein export system ATPase subunit